MTEKWLPNFNNNIYNGGERNISNIYNNYIYIAVFCLCFFSHESKRHYALTQRMSLLSPKANINYLLRRPQTLYGPTKETVLV